MDSARGIHAGHRSRMREKLELYGRDVFHTHELLEMLLYHVIPYKDTNPTAKRLLLRFGTLDGVLSATREELMTVEGIGAHAADMLAAVGRISVCDAAEPFYDEAVHSFLNYGDMGEFFAERIGKTDAYETAVLLLDNSGAYLDYRVCGGDFGVSEHAAYILDFAIKANAPLVAVAHSHPFGPLFPTAEDVKKNSELCAALENIGISLYEHYIVSGTSFVGLMKRADKNTEAERK